MPVKYQNFDLLIEGSGEHFKSRVVDSPCGEASTKFDLPFSQTDVENFFVQIGHARLIESPQSQKMREFGQLLFDSTFSGDVRDRLRESLSQVRRNGEGLRIRLRIANRPELTNLPWEFMYDASLNRFLTLSVETPLVRYLDMPGDIQPLTIRPPLRILVMISSPRNFPTLNVQKEWENLQESVSGLENRGLVSLTRLEHPTLQALQRQLRRGEYHIFHFIGHGVFSKYDQDGQLLFEDEMRGGDRVSGRDLGILLHDHHPLRLAVLNACEGARSALEDQFSGTAQSLMLQGLPAVIAMQFLITDFAAITLAREFYAALADGYPVDAALTEARKAIKTQGNELEWGTPVLYMRAPNGQIFDVASMPAKTPKPDRSKHALDPNQLEHIEALYTEALEAYYLENWNQAYQKLQEVFDSHPGYEDAPAKLEITKQKLHLSKLTDQASAAEAAADWDKAIETLEKLVTENPNFENAKSRLTKARRQKQLGDLYAEAERLTQAGKWQAVLNVFTEINAIDPRYPDVQGLRSKADQQLKIIKREAELENNYSNAIRAFDAGDWRKAIKLLRYIHGLQAGYRETERLLQRAEAEFDQVLQARKPSRDKLVNFFKKIKHREKLFYGLSAFAVLAALVIAWWIIKPAYSPFNAPFIKGNQFYFTSDRSGKNEIYRIESSGEIVQVTNSPGNSFSWSPVFSPDGKLHFTSNRSGKNEIYRIDPTGEIIKVTNSPSKSSSWGSMFSRDGRMYFTSDRSGKNEIYRIEKTGNISQVTYSPDNSSSWGPAFAPNNQLYFTTNRSGKTEIYQVDSNGKIVQVTRSPGNSYSKDPIFSPDGRLYFTSNRSGKNEIYRIESKGAITQVTSSPDNSSSWNPMFSLDNRLYFTSNRSGTDEIYRIESSGEIIQVTHNSDQ